MHGVMPAAVPSEVVNRQDGRSFFMILCLRRIATVCCRPVTWADESELQLEPCSCSLPASPRCPCEISQISRFRRTLSGCNRLMAFHSGSSVSTRLRPLASASAVQGQGNLLPRGVTNGAFCLVPADRIGEVSHIPTSGSFGVQRLFPVGSGSGGIWIVRLTFRISPCSCATGQGKSPEEWVCGFCSLPV
jgi:hypothetical protein